MSARIDVFISSTSHDLPDHRKQAMDACLRMGMFPIMMEHLPASDADAIEASLKMVDDAEIYLGIFAWRYGYVPAGHNISITEMEYNRAVERGIPRLIFVMHDDHPVKGSDVEKGPSAAKLEMFKSHLLTEQVVNFFQSPEELRGQIIHGLVPHRLPDPSSLHSRYASEIPLPPEPYIAHPYTLLQTKDLIGRQKELDMLTQWATQSDAAVFNFVVAIGGMGKSALTWKWFNDVAPDVMPDLAGRMWWSFYESDASFENFVIRALAYVSRRSRAEIEEIPPSDREAQLLAILDNEPFLLVWDGFERTMLAYARMDAARMTDDDLDEKTANYVSDVAGLPESAAQSFTGKHQLRKTADPRIGVFLRKLLAVRKSRILVSTRLYPAELQSETGQTLPRSAAYFLRGLEDTDALALWQTFGISGSAETLLPIFHSFGNYPLLIRALAGEVASFRRKPGDFEKWRATYPDFSPFELPIVQVRSHVLAFALHGLGDKVLKILQTIAAFRTPANYDMLVDILVGKEKTFEFEDALDRSLLELEDRGLLGWDRRSNRYDLHPVTRGIVWDMTNNLTQQAIFHVLRDYFELIPTPSELEVGSLDELTPAIELYNALLGLERYDDAFQVFYNRLARQMQFRLGVHRQRAELLEMLFPDGIEQMPRLRKRSSRTYTLSQLARSYRQSGRLRDAIAMFERSIISYDKEKSSKTLSLVLGQWSDTLSSAGRLYLAEMMSKRAYLNATDIGDTLWRADSMKWLGWSFTLCGATGKAEHLLQWSQRIFVDLAHIPMQVSVGIRILWLYLFQRQYDRAIAPLEQLIHLVHQANNEQFSIRVMRFEGEIALQQGNLDKAGDVLHQALIRARDLNIIEDELAILVALAQCQTNTSKAHELLSDVWEAATSSPYPLIHADALNVLAQIERDEGHTAAAIEAATQAYQLAWCDGPPYAYHWGLEAAKKHLDELGAPYPNMPPFDPSKHEPMPDIEIDPPDEFSN